MVTHGDFQTWITENLHRNLTRIINAKADYKFPYYILVVFKKGYNGPSHTVEKTKEMDLSHNVVIHTRMILTNKPPMIKLVGTACWKVDNKTGQVECMYILPPDKPVVGTSFEDEKAKDSVMIEKSKQGLPLVYNR